MPFSALGTSSRKRHPLGKAGDRLNQRRPSGSSTMSANRPGWTLAKRNAAANVLTWNSRATPSTNAIDIGASAIHGPSMKHGINKSAA